MAKKYVRMKDRKPTKNTRLLELKEKINDPEYLKNAVDVLALRMTDALLHVEKEKSVDNHRRR
jgi:hypothetical protein